MVSGTLADTTHKAPSYHPPGRERPSRAGAGLGVAGLAFAGAASDYADPMAMRIGKRRDRHGRGIRGPSLPPALPAWRTSAEKFDDIISWDLGTFRRHLGPLMDKLDFAVLDVPGQDPAPWEDGVPLCRFLPFERPSKVHGRIIFYRMPILEAARRTPDPRLFIHDVVTSQLASALDMDPEDIDYF